MVNIGMGFKLDAKEKNESETSDIDDVIKKNETKSNLQTHKRVNSGIQGLDELMNGGFPKGNIVLISGTNPRYGALSRNAMNCRLLTLLRSNALARPRSWL